jgi:predicted helicase
MITHTVATQPYRRPGDRKDRTTEEKSVPRVQILDPAVGTATFLNETIKYIYQDFKGQEGRWPAYVNENLIKRLFGFELMMAPYTIAHMKLSMTLKETGVDELTDRLGVYLTNTLEEGLHFQGTLFDIGLAGAVSEESRLAAQVKSEHPVMVVMGNPPYSVSSSNKSDFIEKLVGDYKANLNERNIQPLSDDYIKFIRFAEHMISKNGSGILAMITNNSYIDGSIHRHLRRHLLSTFDKVYILDLHGSYKKKEVSPDGSQDENIFDIQQGVAIILALKITRSSFKPAIVFQADLYGKRPEKFAFLDSKQIKYKQIFPKEPTYYLTYKDTSNLESYIRNVSIGTLFKLHNAGVATGNDKSLVTYDQLDLYNNFPAEVDLPVISYNYRPFDSRFSVYDSNLIQRLRTNTMNHAKVPGNISLLVTKLNRQVSTLYVGLVEGVTDRHYLDSAGDSMHVFPLYLHHNSKISTPNFDLSELNLLTQDLQKTPTPENVLDYIYAIMHSPSYQEKYKEFLKTDFPRIPIPTQAEFDRLVPLGRELRELHLMHSPIIDEYQTTFPISGDCMVEKLTYIDGKVWINKTQYFGNVPELAWNFYIGGYQPAQKWLKDRKGRQLSDADLIHYQRIIKILLETDRIMKEIG